VTVGDVAAAVAATVMVDETVVDSAGHSSSPSPELSLLDEEPELEPDEPAAAVVVATTLLLPAAPVTVTKTVVGA
jgi:hypothetical protein